MRCRIAIIGCLLLASCVNAQATMPPLWDELPKQAATWPAAWAALVREAAPAEAGFEKEVLKRVDALLSSDKPSPESYGLAETVLAATLRHHRSVQRGAPLGDSAPRPVDAELEQRLARLRSDWLKHLHGSSETAEALRLAERWLPSAQDGPLRAAIASLWLDQAKTALAKPDLPLARIALDRLEAQIPDAAGLDEVRKSLRARAESLLKEATEMPDAMAIRALEEALVLWPGLPGAKDSLERRKGTYRTLVVAVRSLPEQLSPATAATEIEKQSLELLFDRLVEREQPSGPSVRYRARLATALPGAGLTAPLSLRRDAYWSSGEPVTAADIRQTALLMSQSEGAGRSALWRMYFLEVPRVEANPFQATINFRQGLFDPLAPLNFWVLPQFYRGKQLQRLDDPEFAKAPAGSGPFQFVGVRMDGGKPYAAFQANPHDPRQSGRSLREIRMTPWIDARKGLAKPLPQMVLDAPTGQLAALKELGYSLVAGKPSSSVSFLAINHRKPALASTSLRRALAAALDRKALLDRHFRAEPGKYHATSNGLFPRDSWASAPAPRVPAELFDLDQARSDARKVKGESDMLNLTLKYPTGDARVKAACGEIATVVAALFQEVGVQADVKSLGLTSEALRKAIEERDYDLAYTSAERLDDPVRLALFFDRQEDATRAGGSNLLGYDNDAKLHDLVRTAVQHRQFSAVQASMHEIHRHLYDTMPAIPLWQLEVHVLVQPSLHTPPLDTGAVFADIRQWKVDR